MAADLQSHFQYWKTFNLPTLQKNLDVQATDIATRQDASSSARTRLVELSKEFKNGSTEETRKQVAPLLKSFQTEVDALSRRSKAAEAAFLSIYKRLIDVPDPVGVLEQAIGFQKTATRVSDYEIENIKLRETLAEYNTEFAEVKNQEVTIKTLKDKLREYEQKIASEVQSRVADKEKELNRNHQEKEKQLHDTQISFARKLGEAEHQINLLKSSLEKSQSELFEMKSKLEETVTARSDETDLLMADLERANERASLAEKQIEGLNERIAELQKPECADAKGRDLDMAIDQMKKSNLEFELAAKEKEVSQLVEEVQKLQSAASKQAQEFSHRIAMLEDEIQNKNQLFTDMSERLRAQTDYSEVKKELQILKSMEFSSSVEETGDDKSRPLETLLIEKTRNLQSENTKLKNGHSELTVEKLKVEPLLVIDPVSTSPPCDGSLENEDNRSDTGHRITSHTSSPVWSPPLYMNGLDINKECLDTLDISNRVKEILSVHNIGQRLFAKHVLGLSQGTVSELLSKPKHWDKLTEKGRESYRKMYYWLRDMRNIDALKNMSPRKPPGPAPLNKQDSTNAEERISQILKEAQDAMTNRQSVDQSHYLSQHPHHKARQHTPHYNNNSYQPRPSQHRTMTSLVDNYHNESSEALVSRIYEEELLKLAEQAKLAGNLSEYQLYQAELQRVLTKKSRMSPNSSNGSVLHTQDEPEDLTIASDKQHRSRSHSTNHRELKHISANRRDSLNQSTNQNSLSSHHLTNQRELAERLTNQSDRSTDSPLQQMQNITNQFFTSTQAHLLQQKPLKHVLPPISQDQFDRYISLNTEELVRKVKELLSQYSISQRLFGENVLGLSQGSVSDLLARPKPWSMLTQKGREPFIRMKIFAEDPIAVKNLMSNQYKINNSLHNGATYPRETTQQLKDQERSRSTEAIDNWIPTMVPNQLTGLMQAPSVIELVAATGELDTLNVTSRVKEMLQFHNIGQKLFGEAVLGLSQDSPLGAFTEELGSVSDMLSKPKPWTLLSLKGREPFVRMHLWLSDPMNVVRLKSYQAEIKAFRRRSGSLSQTEDSNDRSSPYYSKKPRYSFTEDQKNMLRHAFINDPYPTSTSIENLAVKMDLNPKTVINWFHNHRMRSKQQNRDENGHRINGVYIKQELPDTTSQDSCQNSFNGSFKSSTVTSPESYPLDSPESPSPVTSTQPIQTARKRKSSHPQYVSEGAVLDKHNTSDDMEDQLIDVGGPPDLTPDNNTETPHNAPNEETSGTTHNEPNEKIARLEKGLAIDDLSWDDEPSRQECLKRLETTINDTDVKDDWEF